MERRGETQRDAERRGETRRDEARGEQGVRQDKLGRPWSPSPAFMPGRCPAWPVLPGTHCPHPSARKGPPWRVGLGPLEQGGERSDSRKDWLGSG